ncbi:MAG: methylenetetrahydrofolate reductase [Desulfobaccales bacterium]|jgi:methylenetetrahydrofolate reductase (NADPH)
MKVTEMWKKKQPTVSFEFFPARNAEAAEKLGRVIAQLAIMEPDLVSVTFGAGGSTREGSRQLVDSLKNDLKLEVMAYFAGYGLGPDDIQGVMNSYLDLGVDNVLVVRGDPPHGQPDFKPHSASLPHASDMLEFIRPRYHFCLGAAGYPEGHIEAESKQKDLEYLKLKVDKGAEYIITNYFYDNRYYFDFVATCRSLGLKVPIVPGIMPIFSLKMMDNLAKLCGASISDDLRQRLAALPEGDIRALLNFGIDFAFEQCQELIGAGVPGLHFYTMDRSQSTAGVVARLRREGLL